MVCAPRHLVRSTSSSSSSIVGLSLFGRDVVELGVDIQIFFDGQIEVAGQRLGNYADRPANAVGVFAHVVSANAGRSGGDRDERGHHADQRGFPRAVRTQQAKDFFFLHVEGNVIDGGEVAVLFDDMVHLDGIARVDRRSSAARPRPGLRRTRHSV